MYVGLRSFAANILNASVKTIGIATSVETKNRERKEKTEWNNY